jgi:uncharacterized caspase-like protein
VSGKFALIIGNSEYTDPSLARLTAPGKDVEAFAHVLADADLCAFDEVKVLLNEPHNVIMEAIDGFFCEKKPDDLLILYFSGHGVRDELGALYLAVKNTKRFHLLSTAIKSDSIRELMDQSRSKRQILILDCCNSGAFARGTKGATGMSLGTASAFEVGYGRIILTASDATQFAWEGDQVIGKTENSLFTHFLMKGLKGEADLDCDGRITVDELYDYTYEQVKLATPKQTPSKFSDKQQGEIVLRQITRLEDIRPASLPEQLANEITNLYPEVRLRAVEQLAQLLGGKNLGLARSAKAALETLAANDDSRRVAQAAAHALEVFHQTELLVMQQAEMDRIAREKAEAERKAEEERIAHEKAQAEQLTRTEQLRREKALLEASYKAEQVRLLKEKAELETRLEQERNAREQAEREATQMLEKEKVEQPLPLSTSEKKGVTWQAWTVLGVVGAVLTITCGLGMLLIQTLPASALPTPTKLGMAATIVGTKPPVIPPLANNTQTQSVAIQTVTRVPSKTPTKTPTPLPKQIGFYGDCIASSYWTPPADQTYTQVNGCWDLGKNGFFAQDGTLLMEMENKDANEFGSSLIARLPTKARVDFDLEVDDLVVPQVVPQDRAAIYFGVLNMTDGEPIALVYQFPLYAGAKSLNIYIRRSPENWEGLPKNLQIGKSQHVTMMVDGNKLQMLIDGKQVGEILTIPSQDRSFQIAFSLPPSSFLRARVSNFSIIEQ